MTSAAIEDLLEQSGFEDHPHLRALLGEIEALGAADAPAPSAELLALMVPSPGTAGPRLRPRHRGAVVVALAVAASLGLGATAAAAAIPEVRRAAQQVVESIVHAVVPGQGTTAPSGTRPDTANPVPAHSTGPGPSATTPAGSAPRSTSAPSSPPRGTVVPASPHATGAPAVPPAQLPKGEHSPPARPHAP